MNTFGVVNYLEDKDYAKTINKANLVYADGWGPVFASRLFDKFGLLERVNAADFIDTFFNKINSKKIRLYLLGSEDEVIETTVDRIKANYPNIVICGRSNGFFSLKDEFSLVNTIRKSRPNLVMVGMGVKSGTSIPSQEAFLVRNLHRLPNSVYWCVGGLFDLFSGMKSRAPHWMSSNGLEWVYRFLQEPRRLWRRYTVYNFKFLYFLAGYSVKKILVLMGF